MKSRFTSWLDYLLLLLITLAFFFICRCGFFMGDDIAMGYGSFSSIKDVFLHTKWFYMNLGGRYFSVASQYFFSGLIGEKIWYDIVNTLFFAGLIMTCGKLIETQRGSWIHCCLIFALLFWFLCPSPSETLFWMAGATTHLWANTLAFVFLCLFVLYKDSDFTIIGKIALFVFSIISAAEFIPCAAICGGLVTYYAFNLKSFKRNAVPLVIGFALGSMLVLFAPGNFLRATDELAPFSVRMNDLFTHPLMEIIKYKALWLFVLVLLLGWIRNRPKTKSWIKDNVFLLIVLGWGIIAFSFVFRAANRALFFPETLSIILLLRYLSCFLQEREKQRTDNQKTSVVFWGKTIGVALLAIAFMIDSWSALAETRVQRSNNDVLMKRISDSGGIVALDRITPSHRMAYTTYFPKWVEEPLAERFGLDSIHIYPHYCQDKFYHQDTPLNDAFIEENYAEDDIFGKYERLTIRIKEGDLLKKGNHIAIHISYTRPRKWYKAWLDKWRNYQYDRVDTVERTAPDTVFDGYCYYVIWMKAENLDNLKGIDIEWIEDTQTILTTSPVPSI